MLMDFPKDLILFNMREYFIVSKFFKYLNFSLFLEGSYKPLIKECEDHYCLEACEVMQAEVLGIPSGTKEPLLTGKSSLTRGFPALSQRTCMQPV